MRVPISWLSDYVDITLPIDQLAEKLTIAGLEVNHVEYYGIPGGKGTDRLLWDLEKIVVGQILEVNPHPDADRLVLATVDYGGDENEVTVTGAPNLFPYLAQGDLREKHLYSPFAIEGATLYDGHKQGQVKMTLKGRPLRGIYNRCMLCSEKELGLSDDHEGIIIIEGGESLLELVPGTPVVEVLGDAVLDIEIIPNIARCASIVGVAREVAALTGQKLRPPDYELVMEGPPVEGMVKLTTDRPDLNPRFVAVVIKGVEQKPSPFWMQHRLRLAGQRPINVVVDISNYVMLEMGQPNHTFDYDFLRRRADEYDPNGPVHIHTRLPDDGERLTTLDGIEHELQPYNILVTDPAGNLSLGGIMGGLDSEISDDTSNVLLEAAAWNFINIRRSSTALKINSEAGFRFSRGVHPSQALLGAKRAAELMRLYAGGTIAQGIIDYYPNPPKLEPVALSVAEVKRIGGIDLSREEIRAILESLEFEVEVDGDYLRVTSPDHRMDIEFAQDLVEEVCRVYGYDRIPTREMADSLPPQRTNRELDVEERIKDLMVRQGFQEVITYRLTSTERENQLLPTPDSRPDDRPYIEITNPITIDRVVMRHSLLASILEIVAANSRFRGRITMFELGQIYLSSEEGILPDELRKLVIVSRGPRHNSFWGEAGETGSIDYFDLKGVVEDLFQGLHVPDLVFTAGTHPSYRPGRTAKLHIGEHQIGWMGELAPRVVDAFDIRGEWPIIAAQIDLETVIPMVPEDRSFVPVSIFPAIHEDIAVIVDKDLPAAAVTQHIQTSGGYLLRDVTLFDVYVGSSIPVGKKSLAYHLTFQAPNKTLNDKTVRKQRDRIVKQLAHDFGAKLRDA
jgi:phenylalanyl-tRNA synthetase beta chain